MTPILLSQWMKEKRNPALLLLFTGITIVAALLFGGSKDSEMMIEVFSESGMSAKDRAGWIALLNQNESYLFKEQDEKAAIKKVREGRADLTVKLTENDYRIIAAVDNPNVQLAEQYIRTVYERELLLRAAALAVEDEAVFRESVSGYLENPPLQLRVEGAGGGKLIHYDMGMRLLFTFSLYMAMFTVGFKVNAMMKDKASGVWNRLILSPLSKTEMYLGHLLYSTCIGILQILLVFSIFRFVFGYDMGSQYGLQLLVIVVYTLSIVSLSILFVGILKTPEQFTALFSSIIPIMPLISGAYMPPGAITNSFLLGAAEAIPLTHAMEALTGIVMYGNGIAELWIPLAKMLLISVICMGIGINMMERKQV